MTFSSDEDEVQYLSENKKPSSKSGQFLKQDKFKLNDSDQYEEEEVEEIEQDEPNGAECLRRCKEFASVTGTDNALAMFYLQDTKWDLEAIYLFFLFLFYLF